jgi:outer membrane protein TolC
MPFEQSYHFYSTVNLFDKEDCFMIRSLLKYFASTLLLSGCLYSATAQKIISESEAVELAMNNSAAFRGADLQVTQNKFLQKSAFNLPNPEVIAESPSGDFYAVGVLQSVEFPTVYAQQGKLRKQITQLSGKQKEITRQDIARFIRLLYMNTQVAEKFSQQLAFQDTLYAGIASSAQRQFDAGTIDYLAKTFAASQAGEIHNQRLQAEADYKSLVDQVRLYTGQKELIQISPLSRFSIKDDQQIFDSTQIFSNPKYQYYRKAKDVSINSLAVERHKALPGLVVGYLNQGSRETETYYRFRVGVTLPLWFSQYNGNIKAAKAGVTLADEQMKAQQQTLSAELIQASSDIEKYSKTLNYYESTGIKQADEIITTARRFFEGGQTDYVEYLRSTNEGFLIKRRHLEALQNYNQSVLTLNYLTGKL